jgi:hypothetical protein
MQKTYIYNNSIYEEDKTIIHKPNYQLLCLLSIWKKQNMDNSDHNYIIC